MRQRVERLVASNRQLNSSEYNTLSRMSTPFDHGYGSPGKADGKPRRGADGNSEPKKTSAMELFGLIDPYIEEQSNRITKLFEHESAIHNLDKSETERLLREKMTKSHEQTVSLREEIEKLKRKLGESQNKTNMLKVESDVLQAERSQMLTELTALRSQMQAFEDSNTSNLLLKTKELIDTKTQNVVLQRDLTEIKDKFEKRDAEAQMLQDELKQWGGYVRHDRKKKDEEIAELKEVNNDFEGKNNRLKKELADLMNKYHEEKTKLNKDIEGHLVAMRTLQEGQIEVKNQLSTVTAEYTHYKQTYDKDKYLEMMRKIDDMKLDLERSSATVGQLEKLIKSYKLTIEEEENKNKSLNEEMRIIKEANEGLKREMANLKQEEDKKPHSKKTVEVDSTELKTLKDQISELRLQVSSKDTDIQLHKSEIEFLRTQLKQNKDESGNSTPQQPTSGTEEAKLKEMLKRRDEKIKQLNQENISLKEAAASKQPADPSKTQAPQQANEVDTASKAELQAALAENAKLNQTIESLNLQNSQLTAQVKDLQAQLGGVQSQAAKKEPEVEAKPKESKGVSWFW